MFVRTLSVLILSLFVIVHASAKMTGRQVIEKQKKLQKVKTEVEMQKMILVDRNNDREIRDVKRQMREGKPDEYKTLIAFLGPAEIKGTSLRTWQHKSRDDDQWLYLPANGKEQRIAKGSKKTYFMGTDYTYEDLQSEDTDDNKYKLLREEKCGKGNEHTCYVIEAIPANKKLLRKSGYSKRILYIRNDIFVTVKTEYFNKRGKHVKTQTAQDFKNIKGTVWRPHKSVMNNIKNKHKTLIGVVSLKVNQNVPEEEFSEQFILKGKHIK